MKELIREKRKIMNEQGPEQPMGSGNEVYDDKKLNEDLEKLEK